MQQGGSIPQSTSLRRFSTTEVAAASSATLAPVALVATRSQSSVSYRSNESKQASGRSSLRQSKIFDDTLVVRGYDSVPLIEVDSLPRGGISFETKAVGRIQFGIPPETIKDSMMLGMEVPSVYIVPVERFCTEMGPALGINLAEFEFPAYFNYFIRGKRCTLVVDSQDAERDIRNVFAETLLGPEIFRDHEHPVANLDEDFDPNFPVDCRPNFYKEFYNFRTSEASTDYKELTIDVLLDFCHFSGSQRSSHGHDKLGIPPLPAEFEMEELSRDRHRRDRASCRRHPTVTDAAEEALGAITEDKGEKGERKIYHRSNSDPDITSPNIKDLHGSILSSDEGSSQSQIDTPSRTTDEKRREPRRSSMPHDELPRDSIRRETLPGDGPTGQEGRRDSLISVASSKASKMSFSSNSISPYDFITDDHPFTHDSLQDSNWMYSQARWLGEVATVYPIEATDEQRRTNATARVEIFKMVGGTEYIIHDVDKDNVIVGKVRFSGSVCVPDELSVEGFISTEGSIYNCSESAQAKEDEDPMDGATISAQIVAHSLGASTFHPPSFGVTVLGNSHGFDKNGSTSGYVLWVNGRGIMIDPPPYSSATLEREGIRPQMIMAIIITHCHADHDAGAFQKVMTGSRVAIITTPTIYNSFIRKYSALSGLRPTLLRHSHRHRPAIVGQPLRFQGAIFYFTYTLHTIPCISFKVEWRGKSIVFTGDHMNIPTVIDGLEKRGVLSKARADDLRHLPIQDCDILLHEAGAPPIHTPLHVLQNLPLQVRCRLFVVHTAAIPKDSGLRVAPTGTAGTIRLDSTSERESQNGHGLLEPSIAIDRSGRRSSGDGRASSPVSGALTPPPNALEKIAALGRTRTSFVESLQDGGLPNLSILGSYSAATSSFLAKNFNGGDGKPKVAPLVFLRPTCVSDAWFILNLLSAVPFFSSLSYAHTMEVLEIAQVSVFCSGEVVIEGPRRPEVLCVVWEGVLKEREGQSDEAWRESDVYMERSASTIWYAGDWTGPVSLQPDVVRSAHQHAGERLRDIVAISAEGVKVIILMMQDLQRILKSGSKLFRKYVSMKKEADHSRESISSYSHVFANEFATDSLLDILRFNSVLSSLTALQKRYLESLAEGPRFFQANDFLWRVGEQVDYAYLIVSGTATLGQTMTQRVDHSKMNRRGSTGAIGGLIPGLDRGQPRRQVQPMMNVEPDKLLQSVHPNSEYARLEVTLQQRVEEMETEMGMNAMEKYSQSVVFGKDEPSRNSRNRFANKVLARLYSRRAYTAGMVFSRGIFLSDTSRMVSGDLAHISRTAGGGSQRSSISGQAGGLADHHCHTSNMVAGTQGCVVMIFPRTTLVPFLDSNPGVLLSLLGSQVVV